MDFDGGKLLIRDAVCPGEWVLFSALRRMEAGQLHLLGDRPAELRTAAYPWKICVAEAPEAVGVTSEMAVDARELPAHTTEALKQGLAFSYPHQAAVTAPSKQTATQQKGRQKDQEAAEDAHTPKLPYRSWRMPSFRGGMNRGKAYGSAVHAVMQYLDYSACADADQIRNQVEEMAANRLITEEQARLVNCDDIAAFFETEYGTMLQQGIPYVREFKFSILDDGSHYGEGLEGEEVLLQGVVDCALLEDDGITVLDFKTDRVTEENLPILVDQYRSQLRVYGSALERIYHKKVKKACLYFFKLNRFVAV